MTSQLILLNGFGAALASDSAVTLGNRRTYETAEKIIPLSNPHRLAVLHSGAVNIHGMPFSVLVNEWAASLGSTPLRTVALYRQNFLSWLADNHDWVGPGRATDDFMYQLKDSYRTIWNKIKESIDDVESESVRQEKCLNIWSGYVDRYKGLPLLSHSEEDWIERAYQNLEKPIAEARNYWFDDIPLNDDISELIDTFTRLYVERGHFLNRAELAFVGFGEKQLLPSYANVEISGFLNDSLLYELTQDRSASLEDGNYFGICPIGQTDSIDLVLQGLDYSTVEVATSAALEVVFGTGQADDEKGAGSKNVISNPDEDELGDKIYEAVKEAFRDWSEKNSLRALRGAISALPVASLAAVARSLIEVQSLSQTITGEMGTVGGPIDVATISRESGFRWVSHKTNSDRAFQHGF